MRHSILAQAVLLIVVGVLFLPVAAIAQTAPLSQRIDAYDLNSGRHDGQEAAISLVYQTTVQVAGAPWLRLRFINANLGSGSYLVVTSLLDGAEQRLDAAALAQWQNTSAFFNGDALDVRLYVAPGDSGVFVQMDEIAVGENGNPQDPDPATQCGPSDDRIASNDARQGRMLTIGCTAWLIGDGRFVSAGHCAASAGSANTIQFNVPPSLPNGTLQHPGPEDQYTVNDPTIIFVNGGVGNDWAVFETFANAQTGLTALQAQGASYSLAQDLGPAVIRITGYGVDGGAANQTQQTHTGPNAGSSGTTMRYQTDTQGGNSGSPVIDEATGRAVGVHTHGGCTTGGGNNNGTSTFNTAFWAQVGNVGSDPIALTVVTQSNGAGTRGKAILDWTPFDSGTDKVQVFRDGSLVRNTADDGHFIERLVPPPASANYQVCDLETGECSNTVSVTFLSGAVADNATTSAALASESEVTELLGSYPNPFNPTSTIRFALAERGPIELSVFNTLGRRVAVLASGVEEAGSHEVQFDASALPSGVYVYALQAGGDRLTGRLLLVK